MRVLDKRTVGDLVRLVAFITVTVLATSLLVIVIGNLTFERTRTYQAVFSDATGVVKGDDVRVAGVKVGVVRDIEIHERNRALVTFTAAEHAPVTRATEAQIRYRNLVGQRYISLNPGTGETTELVEGDTIPITQTQPALDLTLLFNGFKPLFEALSPADINKLSYEIVQVFQGEGGTLQSLLGHTASVTSTLADRDQIISDLIVNLNEVLIIVADRDEELTDLILAFRELVSGLKDDREAILGALDDISILAVETADLVTEIKDPFINDIRELRKLAGNIDRKSDELDRALQVMPIKLEKVGRTAIYGSYFNFYLCDFKGRVRLPGLTVPVDYATGSDRCDLG
ncbi:MCE family protein [Nocardioides limicola]|uniref:MCE family protein n=1 Tax=Nocardioides limicola TaxID=2803368 RepID=UPI00193BF398|nr:MlaD family protein [Nocardioides sp. DJM-14]